MCRDEFFSLLVDCFTRCMGYENTFGGLANQKSQCLAQFLSAAERKRIFWSFRRIIIIYLIAAGNVELCLRWVFPWLKKNHEVFKTFAEITTPSLRLTDMIWRLCWKGNYHWGSQQGLRHCNTEDFDCYWECICIDG